MKRFLASSTLMLFLSGCANFAPEYQQPELPVAKTLNGDEAAMADYYEIQLDAWHDYFKDEQLKTLIGRALENNRELKVAAANVEQARAEYQIEFTRFIPDIGATASDSVTKNSRNYYGDNNISRRYDANIGFLNYEIDFFGKVRNLSDAALAQFFASVEAERSMKLSVIAETANAYYSWVMAEKTLELANQTYASRLKSTELIRLRQTVGIASELDYTQALVSQESVAAQRASIEELVGNTKAALLLLVGNSIEDISPFKSTFGKGQISQDFMLPPNLSSEVLLNRPDIIAAEEQLYAANANIGAARANFFPSITIVGNAGNASAHLSDLFKGGSSTWSFLPQIYLPIFGNSNRANLEVAEATQQKAIANFELAVQSAFSEVYQYMTSKKSMADQIHANKILVNAQRKRLELTFARYETGIDDYVDVLLAQEDLFSAEQAQLQSERDEIIATIQLYKSLGGGDEFNSDYRTDYLSQKYPEQQQGPSDSRDLLNAL